MKINENIEFICRKINRDPKEIKIIAVTKTIDAPKINEAINSGLVYLGENKVQEIMEKYDLINGNIEWHMIGHLQRNKVKYIIDKVKLIHSLDSIRLAKEINNRCRINNTSMDVLIQINIAKDDSKYGIAPDEVYDFINQLKPYDNLRVLGLMTIVPYASNPEDVRPYFRSMNHIFQDLKKHKQKNFEMKYLSMGMTNDYLIAIEEGSNMVRIGTGIFGERNYSK